MSKSFNKPNIIINKVYTRNGDKGYTKLIGGESRLKSNIRIQAYGEIDELNAIIGLSIEHIKVISKRKENLIDLIQTLNIVQHQLFNVGTVLATLPENINPSIPKIESKDILWLENKIDNFNKYLNELNSFVLPGGSEANSWFHLARTVCRRTERTIIELSEIEQLDEFIIQYINRLSDALFVWSRYILYHERKQEILWNPNIKIND